MNGNPMRRVTRTPAAEMRPAAQHAAGMRPVVRATAGMRLVPGRAAAAHPADVYPATYELTY